MNHPPPAHLSHLPPPINHNNKGMDTEFLVQMRPSIKCGSVRNDDIFNLNLGSRSTPWVSIPCLLLDTSHVYWFHTPEQSTKKKQRNQKWDSAANKSYRIWIPALRQVQLKPTAKRGVNKTEALVSFYWSSRSFYPKEPPNWISQKSWTWQNI